MAEWFQSPLIIGAVLAIVGMLVSAGIWIGSVNSDRKSFKGFMKVFREEVRGEFKEVREEVRKEFKEVREEVRKEFKEVRGDIKKILNRLPAHTVDGKSPVQLTEFGKKISKTIEVPKWAKEHAPTLVNKAKGKEEFEVFDVCVEYVERAYKRDPKFTKTIRAGAYNFGTDPSNVLKIYNVELRNHLLKLLPQ